MLRCGLEESTTVSGYRSRFLGFEEVEVRDSFEMTKFFESDALNVCGEGEGALEGELVKVFQVAETDLRVGGTLDLRECED